MSVRFIVLFRVVYVCLNTRVSVIRVYSLFVGRRRITDSELETKRIGSVSRRWRPPRGHALAAFAEHWLSDRCPVGEGLTYLPQAPGQGSIEE